MKDDIFGKQISSLFDSIGITKQDFAEALGIARPAWVDELYHDDSLHT